MRLARGFGIGVVLLQLVGFVVFGLSFHTLFSVTSAVLSGDAISYTSSVDNSTGELTVGIEGELRNSALLGADVYLDVAILNPMEEDVASNSTSVHVGSGERHPIALTLLIPQEEAERWESEEDKGFLKLTFSIRTLENLVGFSNTSIIPLEGGE